MLFVIVKVERCRPTPAWTKRNFTGIDYSNQVKIAELVIKAGANVNIVSKYDNTTPLYSALETCQYFFFTRLLNFFRFIC